MDPHASPAPPVAAPPAAAKPPIPGQPLAIMMLVCALALLIATFSRSWVSWTEGGGESGGIGPMGAEFCMRGMCTNIPWSVLESARVKMSGDISVLGTLSTLGGLAAAAAAGLCGVLILTRKPEKVPVKPVRAALGAAVVVMTFFAMRLLTSSMKIKLGVSYGTVIGLGAAIAAVAIFQSKVMPWLAQLPRPVAAPGGPGAPQMQPPQMQPPQMPSYPCPRCQRPLVWVAQYQRWFCEGCRDYA